MKKRPDLVKKYQGFFVDDSKNSNYGLEIEYNTKKEAKIIKLYDW